MTNVEFLRRRSICIELGVSVDASGKLAPRSRREWRILLALFEIDIDPPNDTSVYE